jgi:hypothetical protein
MNVVAGHWCSPLPPRPWPLPTGSSRYSQVHRSRPARRAAYAARSHQPRVPSWPFISPSERSLLSRNSSQLPKKPRVPPLMGFVRSAPLCRSTVCASTPGSRSFHRPDPTRVSGSCSALVVSHHLDGLLRTGAAGLLHPAVDYGVRRVSRSSPREHPRVPRRGLRLPRAANRTLRRVPLISSRTASLRPLPSCRYHPLFAPGLPGRSRGLMPSPVAEATSSSLYPPRPKPGLAQCACAGRSRCRRGAADGRGRWQRTHAPPRRPASRPDRPATEVAARTPRGSEHICRDRSREDGVHPSPR